MDSEQFAQLMTGITEVKTEQASFRRELLGNGQPGRIQLIENEVDKLKTDQGELKTSAAVTVWKLGTLSAGAGSVLALGAQWLGKLFFHLK